MVRTLAARGDGLARRSRRLFGAEFPRKQIRSGEMADRKIGILGLEVYFPTTFVEQADLGESARGGPIGFSASLKMDHTPQCCGAAAGGKGALGRAGGK